MTEPDTDDADESPDTCPVCGQPYDHKRERRSGARSPTLRRDAAACEEPSPGGGETMYVHVGVDPRPTARTVAVDRTDADDGLGVFDTNLGGVFQ